MNRNTGRTHFKKGHIPWNKGIKQGFIPIQAFKKEDPRLMGENNPLWKGNKVGYHGLHKWIQRKLGKPKKCLHCDSTFKIEWANKNWEYQRNSEDWIPLCRLHHRQYDSKNWGIATLKFPNL